ncbi:9995_t:CDS:10 [Acaulospora morrowiae]|uniref:9995_t:CDS:1 n=1 Tax=Acaulospora morrowiae TaxID=94023 RepID=A0A9N9G1S6_9GLOM|nr:9995_t:CDS:10 [Acaulospora morrowiae]
MVKKKSGRFLNPADAHRKAMRQKEIKKNKMERKRVRTLVMVHKDTSKLEEEIARYRALDREKRLDKNGKIKLKDLQEKLSKIIEAKKAHGVVIQKQERCKTHTFPSILKFFRTNHVQWTQTPGQSDEESGSEYSDNEKSSKGSDSQSSKESDDDISLPSGKAPSDSEDELPEVENDAIMSTQPSNVSRLPPPFGYAPSNLPQYPPAGTYMMYNSSPGSQNNLRSNVMSTPSPAAFPPANGNQQYLLPHPPMRQMQPQGFPLRPIDSPPRPPPFGTQFSHYGTPQPIQVGNKAPRDLIKSKYAIDPLDQVYGSPSRNFPQPKPEQQTRPTVTAIPIIQAEPQVRNLQKELTTFVPASLLRKKASAKKPKVARPIVNAAPNIDDGMNVTTTTAVKRSASTAITLLQQSEYDTQASEQQVPAGAPAKKSRTKKKVDEYDKFMAEMQDLL